MLYGIITVATQQMSAAIFGTNATAEWPYETMLLNISSRWKTILKPGQRRQPFPKAVWELQGCTSQGGTGICSWRWSAAVADGLFVLQGAVSSVQRGLAAREVVECAVCGLCWLAFYTASVEAEISGDTHTHSANALCWCVTSWVDLVCLCKCVMFLVHLFLRARGPLGEVPTGSWGQKFTDREREERLAVCSDRRKGKGMKGSRDDSKTMPATAPNIILCRRS